VIVAALGTGWAFAADAACFAVGFLFILWLPAAARVAADAKHRDGGLGGQIVAGFRYAWADIGNRVTLIVVAVVDFAANGALGVGLPTLAHGRFSAGAAGLINIPRRFGWLIVAFCAWIGVGIVVVGVLPSLLPAALAMGITGIATGVINTYGFSWLQRRTDKAMQGRVMSLVMLASMGLTPVSYAVSGVIANVNATLLFVLAGGMILAAAVGAAISSSVRSLR